MSGPTIESYDRAAADAEARWHDQLSDLVVTAMADVAPEAVRWLWEGRIPLGKLTVLEGDPKGGKSTMTLDLMARVSTNSPMPDGTLSDLDGRAYCVLLTAEDGLADTVRPRLDLAGADVSRVMVWEGVLSTTDESTELRMPSLPLDVLRLEALVTELAAKLVVVDVLAAYLGDRVDSHHDNDVRRALAPLAKMAESTGAAVVVLRHLNKGGGTKAMYRGGGSIGISGQARSILLSGLDPNDETNRRRVLAVTGCNVAAEGHPHSLTEPGRRVPAGTGAHRLDRIEFPVGRRPPQRRGLRRRAFGTPGDRRPACLVDRGRPQGTRG